VKYGTILGGTQPNGADPDSLMVVGNVNSNPIPTLYTTRFTEGVWHNFAITNNFNAGYNLSPDSFICQIY
jgi:hypothetical protein